MSKETNNPKPIIDFRGTVKILITADQVKDWVLESLEMGCRHPEAMAALSMFIDQIKTSKTSQ